MRLSKSTILSPIPGSSKMLLVQPLSGEAAILDESESDALRGVSAGADLPPALPLAALRDSGFAVESDDDEQRMQAEAYATFLDESEKTPTQLIVVPSFGCNLSCVYCYQELFTPDARGLISPGHIDALFSYIDRFHASEDPPPHITLFGGEPLVDTPPHHDRVGRILAAAGARGLDVAIVTNGYDLESFLPAFGGRAIREIQVTLDGPPAIHDSRRMLSTGRGTFDRVAAGIDALVAAGIPVNLRVVVDKHNLPALPALAELADARGWLARPEALFKTQIGRNYELFGCASRQRPDVLFDRLELWTSYAALAEAHPVLRRFHAPRFHGIRHLAETGELPPATFDSCPATKKEWAFGPDGGVYGCTATVGHPAHRLGSYAPAIERDDVAIGQWRARNVFSIPACRDCAVAPLCGGGCGAIAVEQTGHVLGPDCRPVKELLGLGARFYGLDREGAGGN